MKFGGVNKKLYSKIYRGRSRTTINLGPIRVNDIMDLHMLSLRILVPERPGSVFYVRRHQFTEE